MGRFLGGGLCALGALGVVVGVLGALWAGWTSVFSPWPVGQESLTGAFFLCAGLGVGSPWLAGMGICLGLRQGTGG